jgi:hypothetical protein
MQHHNYFYSYFAQIGLLTVLHSQYDLNVNVNVFAETLQSGCLLYDCVTLIFIEGWINLLYIQYQALAEITTDSFETQMFHFCLCKSVL